MLIRAISPGRHRGQWKGGEGESKRLNIHDEFVKKRWKEDEEWVAF